MGKDEMSRWTHTHTEKSDTGGTRAGVRFGIIIDKNSAG